MSHTTLEKARYVRGKADDETLRRLRRAETFIDREYKRLMRGEEGGTTEPKGRRFVFSIVADLAQADTLRAFVQFVLGV
jgi:hypothetical protein